MAAITVHQFPCALCGELTWVKGTPVYPACDACAKKADGWEEIARENFRSAPTVDWDEID